MRWGDLQKKENHRTEQLSVSTTKDRRRQKQALILQHSVGATTKKHFQHSERTPRNAGAIRIPSRHFQYFDSECN